MNPDLLCMGCMEDLAGGTFCRHCGRAANEPAASSLHLPPRTVLHDQYVLGRALGHGGFGITYLAWDLNLARRLAVKEYLPGGMGVREAGSHDVTAYTGQSDAFKWGLEKFLEEARVLARFQNQPGIVAVLNFFRENGTAYLVMEYLDGITLQEYLIRNGEKIDPAVALRIMTPVMNALREVHKAGVLHRDISPDNIYLCASSQVKVLDFGAARYALSQQNRSLSVILKEGYAPEEQYRTKGNQGPWTDVYATAGTLYRAITGVIPPAALDRKENDELLPPSALGVPIDSAFEQALLKGMAIRAADRFASMEEFQAAIANQTDGAAAPVLEPILRGAGPGVATRPMRVETGGETRPMRVPTGGETRPMAVIPGSGETRAMPRSGASAVLPAPPIQEEIPPQPRPDRNSSPVWKRAPKWLTATLAVLLAGVLFLVFGHKKTVEAAPAIQTFRAQSSRIRRGQPAVLQWNVEGNADVTLDPGGKTVARSGNLEVRPEQTTTYTLSARNKSGIDAQKVTVEVGGRSAAPIPDPVLFPKPGTHATSERALVQPLPRIEKFSAEPATIHRGESATLRWSVGNAKQVLLLPGFGRVLSQGAVQVSPPASQTFTLSTLNEGSAPASRSVSINVLPPETVPSPAAEGGGLEITGFDAEPSSITAGQPVTLHWSVRGATSVNILPGLGTVPISGSRTGHPRASTTFTLTATRPGQPAVQATTRTEVTQPETGLAGNADGSAGPARGARPLFLNVLHDHGGQVGGVLSRLGRQGASQGSNDYCSGTLTIQNSTVSFNGGAGHNFSVPLSNVGDVQLNRLPLQGRGAFHIRLNDGANYNFVPQGTSASQAVAQIRSLLNR